MADDIKYYDIPDLPRVVNSKEIAALIEMVNSEGWNVFMDLRRIEARSSVQTAMNIATENNHRLMHQALYQGFMNDLSFADRLTSGVRESEPKDYDEVKEIGSAVEDYGTIPVLEKKI